MTNYNESLESHLSGTTAILKDFIRSCLFAFGYSVALDGDYEHGGKADIDPGQMIFTAGFWRDSGCFWLGINVLDRNGRQLDVKHYTLDRHRGLLRTNKIQLFGRNDPMKYQTEDILLAQQFLDAWFPNLYWRNRYTVCRSLIHDNVEEEGIYYQLCHDHHGRYICKKCAEHLVLSMREVSTEQKRNKTEREKLTTSLRWQILDKYACTCQGCGRKPPEVKVHVDHKIPIAQGGKTEVDNLHVLCEKCNLGKSDKMPSQKTMELWGMAAD